MRTNPLHAWVVSVVFLLTFYLTLFWSFPGQKKPGLIMMFVCFALGQPTWGLVQRFTHERQRELPIPFQQEIAVAFLSLFALVCSVCAFGTVCLSKRLGLLLPTQGVWLLMVFSGSALLSLAFGYASQQTKAGQWGMKLSAAWLLFIVILAAVKLIVLAMKS